MRVSVIDAFSAQPFHGNPAGVVELDRDVPASWMQRVAAELRHAETAFVARRTDGDFDLRWFTPTVEVDLCGHATLACAHVLAGRAGDQLRFHTRSGVLTASVGSDGLITLDFPAEPATPIPAPAALAEMLGATPRWVGANRMDLLVEVRDAATVRALEPDLTALATLEHRCVVVTAVPDGAAGEVDFVSRVFGPRVGVDEDPVTGSAHCALGPFWAARLGRAELTGAQLSDRGGIVGVALDGDRVLLRGRASTVLDGELRALP